MPHGETRDPELNRLWVFVWFWSLGWDVSSKRECAIGIEVVSEEIVASEESMVSEQVRTTVGLRHGWGLRMRVLRASQRYCHWIGVLILTEVKFWPLQMPLRSCTCHTEKKWESWVDWETSCCLHLWSLMQRIVWNISSFIVNLRGWRGMHVLTASYRLVASRVDSNLRTIMTTNSPSSVIMA